MNKLGFTVIFGPAILIACSVPVFVILRDVFGVANLAPIAEIFGYIFIGTIFWIFISAVIFGHEGGGPLPFD